MLFSLIHGSISDYFLLNCCVVYKKDQHFPNINKLLTIIDDVLNTINAILNICLFQLLTSWTATNFCFCFFHLCPDITTLSVNVPLSPSVSVPCMNFSHICLFGIQASLRIRQYALTNYTVAAGKCSVA